MVTKQGVDEAIDIAVKIGVPVTLAGLGIYVVYKLANPSPNCTTPGTACYSAIQPYQTVLNTCATQLADLVGTMITQRSAPTPSQVYLMQQLMACMNTAATNEAQTAKGFNQPSLNDLVTYAGEVALIVAVAYAAGKYLLPGLAGFINNLRNTGKVSTSPSGGAGINAVIINGFVQYAVSQGLITSAIAAAWVSSLSTITSGNLADINAFWTSLQTLNLITVNVATVEIGSLTSEMNSDLAATDSVLLGTPLPMAAYEQGNTPPWDQHSPVYVMASEMMLEPVPSDCGCR